MEVRESFSLWDYSKTVLPAFSAIAGFYLLNNSFSSGNVSSILKKQGGSWPPASRYTKRNPIEGAHLFHDDDWECYKNKRFGIWMPRNYHGLMHALIKAWDVCHEFGITYVNNDTAIYSGFSLDRRTYNSRTGNPAEVCNFLCTQNISEEHIIYLCLLCTSWRYGLDVQNKSVKKYRHLPTYSPNINQSRIQEINLVHQNLTTDEYIWILNDLVYTPMSLFGNKEFPPIDKLKNLYGETLVALNNQGYNFPLASL